MTTIAGSIINLANTAGSGNWGQQVISGRYDANVTDSFYLTNTGTTAGTGGVYMQFTGHNGTVATNGRLGFDGTEITYTNNASGGKHRFNAVIKPSVDNSYTCGESGCKMVSNMGR